MNKTSLILGGNGALGKAMVTQFKKAGWRVASMDLMQNQEADLSILVDKEAKI